MAGLFHFGLSVYPCTMKKTKPGRKASKVLRMALLLLLSGVPLWGWAREVDRAPERGPAPAAAGRDLSKEEAVNLTKEAERLREAGNYQAAVRIWERLVVWYEKNIGPDHPETASILNFFAFLYFDQSDYSNSEPLYLRALKITEKALGSYHLETAGSLNSLALVYKELGAYSKAEPLYLRALEIRENGLGADHPDTAASLNNLASLYSDQGAYSKAEPLYLRSLQIKEKALGPDHPSTATSLNNLAELYTDLGAYSKAEPLFLSALKITEKALGLNHPSTATSLNNLGVLYYTQGAYSKAEALYIRALKIREKALGPDHPVTATSLNSLAVLYYTQGAYSEAERLYLRSLKINEKALGPDHPSTATSLNNLALLYSDQGAYSKATALLRRGLTTEISLIQQEAPYLARNDREAFVESFGNAYETSFIGARRDGEGANLALFARLNRQGLLQEIEQRQALLASLPGPQQSLAEELRALTRQLASVSISPGEREKLRQRQEELEKQLYRLLPQLRPRIVQVEGVATALPAAGALVEFQQYQPFDGKKPGKERWGEARYLALVLRPTGAITAMDLGPAATIDLLIHQALTATREGLSDTEQLWRQVGQKVVDPLGPALAGVQTLFISPDGELNRVPFAALPVPQAAEPCLSRPCSSASSPPAGNCLIWLNPLAKPREVRWWWPHRLRPCPPRSRRARPSAPSRAANFSAAPRPLLRQFRALPHHRSCTSPAMPSSGLICPKKLLRPMA
jgi:tetratricopeptide (TPR) repeat protein